MIMSSSVLQFETELGIDIEINLADVFSHENAQHARPSCTDSTSQKTEWDELELYTCWKKQTNGRYGGGSPAPLVPRSQRLYDGENSFEFCEQFPVR